MPAEDLFSYFQLLTDASLNNDLKKEVVKNINLLFQNSNAMVIDFTSGAASASHASLCAVAKVPLVIGSTGMTLAQMAEIKQAATCIPLVVSPNMSVGINVMMAAEIFMSLMAYCASGGKPTGSRVKQMIKITRLSNASCTRPRPTGCSSYMGGWRKANMPRKAAQKSHV